MSTRTTLNFWIDLVSLLVMLGLAFTGGLIHFVLPAGSGHWQTLWGLDRHGFGDIHFYLALAAVALLLLHVVLHWGWICCVVGKAAGTPSPSPRARALAGGCLALVVLLLGAGLWWSASMVHDAERAAAPGGAGAASAGPPAAPPSVPESLPPERGRGNPTKNDEDCPAGLSINGRTTLAEAARICGLEVQRLKELLELPPGVDPLERLGRIKRNHGLEVHTVRRLACR